MIERIKILMESANLTPATFADKTGINRATMSHILVGRGIGNDKIQQTPSTDVIVKILDSFPKINADWLLRGESPMYKADKAQFTSVNSPDLFSEKPINPMQHLLKNEPPQEKVVKEPEFVPETPKKEIVIPPITPSAEIDKIVIFYKNKTFVTLKPEE